MPVTQADINATIYLAEGELVSFVKSAAVMDSYGNWDQAVCFLEKAEKVATRIGVLETKCDVDISEFVNENAAQNVCNIDEDRGIGEWAIKPSIRGCNVFRIRDGQLPPPYGEFTQNEFVTEEFTEVRTS